MSRALTNRGNRWKSVLFSCILTLGICQGTLATTVCDTDPAAVRYTPTVDPTLLNGLLNTLGSINIDYVNNTPITLLFRHTLHVSVDGAVSLSNVDFLVTPAFGSLEVKLMMPSWGTSMSTSVSHAPCPDCIAEYNACVGGCNRDYNSCCTYFACELICGPIWLGCESVCAGALTLVCPPRVVLCEAEKAGIDLLLGNNTVGMSFASATVTQRADICVSGDCKAQYPLETTSATTTGFSLQLFPTGDPLGIGSWLNGIISGLVNWALDIQNKLASFFVTPQGEGVLINLFGFDIQTDGCMPVNEVIDCAGGGCSTVDRPAGATGRYANLIFYGLPVGLLLGILLWRRRR